MGDRGVCLFRANGYAAMKLGSSYLLYWYFINELKARGFRYYDLGNATSPNLAGFKKRLGGKHVDYLPPFAAGDSVLGKVCGNWGQQAIQKSNKAKSAILRKGRQLLTLAGK